MVDELTRKCHAIQGLDLRSGLFTSGAEELRRGKARMGLTTGCPFSAARMRRKEKS